jgi:hypothetical protein
MYNVCRLSNRENLEPSLQVKTEQDRTLRDIRPQEAASICRHKEALVSETASACNVRRQTGQD